MSKFVIREPGKTGGQETDNVDAAFHMWRSWLRNTGVRCDIFFVSRFGDETKIEPETISKMRDIHRNHV